MRAIAISFFSAVIVSGPGCQTTKHGALSSPQRAVLQEADEASIAAIKTVISKSMNRAEVQFGPGDLTRSSVISVLPPPLAPIEGRSTVRPTLFTLMMLGGDCLLRRDDSDELLPVPDIDCELAQ